MPEAGERADPFVKIVGKPTLNPMSCDTWENWTCTSSGSTTEPTLLAQVWVNQPQNCEHGRTIKVFSLPIVLWWHGQGRIAPAMSINTWPLWS